MMGDLDGSSGARDKSRDMRDLKDYSIGEWLAAEPLAHRLRRARNVAVDRIYRARRAEGQETLVADLGRRAAAANATGGAMAFTIAFNLVDAVALLSDAMARFLPGTALVVCDNSSRPEARAAIARLCAERGHPYCALPPSPMKTRGNASRSHAVALNWVLGNLIRPAAPDVFALIDHDLVPLAPVDLAGLVARQPAYGMVRKGDRFGGWYLWPGYSVFRLAALGGVPLDFGTDTPLTLDTGGQNWGTLYRHMDLSRLAKAATRPVFLPDAETGRMDDYLLADAWLHVGGAGHGPRKNALRNVRNAFYADPDGLLARLTVTSPATTVPASPPAGGSPQAETYL